MMQEFAFQWHITDECDQRCKHCYLFTSAERPRMVEMPWEQMVAVVDNMERMCSRMGRKPYLYITGGDPLLHSRFWDLLELLHSRQIAFTIMANPFHITLQGVRQMRCMGARKYQLSLDGLPATHDSFRKPGSFDATLQAIATLHEGQLPVAVMTTVSAINIDEVPELIDVVVAHKVDIFAFGRYCPTSGQAAALAKGAASWHISPDRYRRFLDQCWQRFVRYRNSSTTFSLKDHLWTLYLHERGLFRIPDGLSPDTIYGGCNCGNCHFTVTAEGRLMACRRFESYVGSVANEMYDVWQSPQMDHYRHHEQFEKCRNCELLRFCRGCPAVAYGYTGNFYAPDPQCWKAL